MTDSTDSMDAEFDTLAAWTAEVAAELDPAYRIPAGCRGSSSPGALHWFLEHLHPEPGQIFLDCGAGVGGPAAFAQREAGVRPVLTDPEAGACRAARFLFGLPAVRAGSRLPIATAAIHAGWSLGVLCTVDDQAAFLGELRRILRPDARFGLIVYCAAHPDRLEHEAPEGNRFPTVEALGGLLAGASMQVRSSGWMDDFAALPGAWDEATAAVQNELKHRHGTDPRWLTAEEQSARMGSLLASGEIRGQLLVVSAA